MDKEEDTEEPPDHGIPDDILDGIFSDEDKGNGKTCSTCGCMVKSLKKEEIKDVIQEMLKDQNGKNEKITS